MFNHKLRSVRVLRRTVLVSLVVAVISGAMSIYLSRRLAIGNTLQGEIGSARVASVSLYAHGLQMGQAMRNILLDPSNRTAYANHESAAADFETTYQALERQANHILQDDADAQKVLASIGSDFKEHVRIQHRIQEAARSGDFEGGKKMLNSDDTPLWRRYKQSILDFGQRLERRAQETSSRIQVESRWAESLSWLTGVLLIMTALQAFTAAGRVSSTLTQLGELLILGVTQITDAARQVSSSSDLLAQSASEQAASLEETSASSEQINSVASRNSENSRSATELATQSEQMFDETNRMLAQSVASMDEINRSSGQISKIIKAIDEIAFQTNILALNAAVEAARAGEAGMGFSVVAEEVRNLAQRSAQAARETAALIEESIAKSREGKVNVDQVAASMCAITQESAKVKTLVEQVNLGSLEQAKGIGQVANALVTMEQMTQRIAASAEEGASAAAELNAQSESLRDVAERLNAVIIG